MDKNTEHIFFDFDGTLCASDADIRKAWHDTLEELKLPCPGFDKIFRPGPSLQEMTGLLFPSLPQEMKEKLWSSFKSRYDHSDFENTVPYPWITPWLEKLKRQGCRLYVLTNKRKVPTLFLLEKCSWTALFEGVFSQDSFPGPALAKSALLRKALETLQLRREDAMIVGDMSGDIIAGKQNHIRTAGVLWGYGTPEELREAGADEILTEEDFS